MSKLMLRILNAEQQIINLINEIDQALEEIGEQSPSAFGVITYAELRFRRNDLKRLLKEVQSQRLELERCQA